MSVQDKYIIKTHIIHQSMWRKWIYMSKILIKMIRIHGVTSKRQSVHLILERLNYFSNHLLIAVKIIWISHTIFQPKPRDFFKSVVMIHQKRMVQKNGENFKKNSKTFWIFFKGFPVFLNHSFLKDHNHWFKKNLLVLVGILCGLFRWFSQWSINDLKNSLTFPK